MPIRINPFCRLTVEVLKTDPNTICENGVEHRGWAFVHDAIAHPLMALTGWSALSLRFHNYTSHKAWPREQKPKPDSGTAHKTNSQYSSDPETSIEWVVGVQRPGPSLDSRRRGKRVQGVVGIFRKDEGK